MVNLAGAVFRQGGQIFRWDITHSVASFSQTCRGLCLCCAISRVGRIAAGTDRSTSCRSHCSIVRPHALLAPSARPLFQRTRYHLPAFGQPTRLHRTDSLLPISRTSGVRIQFKAESGGVHSAVSAERPRDRLTHSGEHRSTLTLFNREQIGLVERVFP